jgi:hypothetical protein
MEKEIFERLIEEYREVIERAEELRAFITDDEKFEQIDALNKDLCLAQLKTMESYIAVLSIRIGYNAPQNNEVVEEA